MMTILRLFLLTTILGPCVAEFNLAKLDDVDCDGKTGFLPVGGLAATDKDCVFVVCDGLNPDPRSQKYPKGCDKGYQVGHPLNIIGSGLYFPNICKGMTVSECTAIYFYQIFCVVEASTTDNINCGPTFAELKGIGGDDVDKCKAGYELQRNIELQEVKEKYDKLIAEC